METGGINDLSEITFTIKDADLDKLNKVLKDVNVKECPYFEVQDKYGNVAKYYRKGYVPDTNVGDMISRQAAIDVLNSERVEEDGIHYWRVERNKTIDAAVKIIQALPSAELESCEDAISRSEAIKVIEAVPDGNWKSIRYSKEIRRLPEPHWIPCSERLPEGSQIVLLTLPKYIDDYGQEFYASVICGHYIGGKDCEWGISDGTRVGYGLVSVRYGVSPIAWMPLPEPYREVKE